MRAWSPDPGNVWNPLRNYPRNSPCPCQSGKKFKKCHGAHDKLNRVCTEKDAKTFQKMLDMELIRIGKK